MNKAITLFIIFSFTLSLSLSAKDTAKTTPQEVMSQIKKLGKTLKTNLVSQMKEHGPKAALKFCDEQAIPLTNELNTQHITVGRVSHKPRNPQNKIQTWMQETTKRYLSGENKEKFTVVKIPNGKSGIIKPIITSDACLKCHGEKIDPALAKEIASLYPKDQATGFKTGEIRGFFWATYE